MDSMICSEAIRVEVDGELISIVPVFLENRRRDCIQINAFLEADAMDKIRVLGHQMKGAGGSYGFDAISEIGEIIENAAVLQDRPSIRQAAGELKRYLERVSVVYV